MSTADIPTRQVSAFIRDVSARVIDPRFRRLEESQIHEKKPGDLVTDADRQAEAELARQLTAAGGGIVVGEESVFVDDAVLAQMPTADLVWVIDPIDGTRNFVRGSADHAVMVAEVRSGVTTRSWIWQPQLGHLWIAERGRGLTCDGVPVRHGSSSGVVHAVTTLPQRQTDGPALSWGPAHSCCGVDYPMVCRGEQEAAVWFHPNPWDHLPGALMVVESGGVVRGVDGVDYTASHRRDDGPVIAAVDERAWQLVASALSSATAF